MSAGEIGVVGRRVAPAVQTPAVRRAHPVSAERASFVADQWSAVWRCLDEGERTPGELRRELTSLHHLCTDDASAAATRLADATADVEKTHEHAQRVAARNAFLQKEVAHLRAELEDMRQERRRERQRVAEARQAVDDGDDPHELDRLTVEVRELRQQALLHESRALQQASDMAATLAAAAENERAAIRLSDYSSRLQALEAKQAQTLQDWQAERAQAHATLDDALTRLDKSKRNERRLQMAALAAMGQTSAMQLAYSVLERWRVVGEVRALQRRIADLQGRADTGSRLLASAERDLADLRVKANAREDALHERIDKLRKELATAEATVAEFRAKPRLVANDASLRGGAPGGEQLEIDALTAYNTLYKVLRACKDRLKVKCIQLVPMGMHERTTESVARLVIGWTRHAVDMFHQVFTLEDRLGKLRYRLICVSVGVRGKCAALAVKLSLPIGSVERSLVRLKKERYEELITRIASMRAKVETARSTLYTTFNAKDAANTIAAVDDLETEVTQFMRVVKAVEADQFNLSLKLVRLQLEEKPAGDTAAATTPKRHRSTAASPSPQRSSRSASLVARPASTTLAESKALLRDVTAPSPLAPLEDRGAVITAGHKRMVEASAAAVDAVRKPPPLSKVLSDRARLEREERQRRKVAGRPLPPPVKGLDAVASALIPFRSFRTRPEGSADMPKRRVRIADDLMV